MSLRETKRRATARALAQAAFDLALERGVDGFTIDEVAARAGYSRRTFANHYAGKEEAIVGVAAERVRHALDTPPDDELSLVDWLQAVARQQLSGGLLMVLGDLRVLAERHPPLRPHLLEVQRCIRETARDAVLARVEGPGSRIYAHLLVGAAYGALTCVLDGHIPVRLPATPAQDPTPHSDIDVTGDEDRGEMTLGALAYRLPWAFVLTWLIVLGSVLGLAVTSDGHISSSMTIDGTPSQRLLDQLREDLPAASGGQGTLVFTVPEGESLDTSRRASAIADAATEIAALPEVVDRSTFTADAADGTAPTTTPPDSAQGDEPSEGAGDSTPHSRPFLVDGSPVPGVLISSDGSVAMLQMQFTTQVDSLPDGTTEEVVDLAKTAVADTGVTVLPSDSLDAMHPPIGGHEAIGLVIALLVLFITLGSLWAAGLPILTALTGVGIGVGGAFALSSSITLTTATPALALMIGLAVGIDYALFILHRQRRLILTEGLPAGEATARALATAGSAVAFAGSTVVIALVGMTVIGIGFLTTMALVAASTVALAVLIALTLLPALLGILGEKICSPKARARTQTATRPSGKHLTNLSLIHI